MRLSPLRLAAATTALGCLGLAVGASPAGAAASASQIVSNAVVATDAATSVQVTVSALQNKQRESFNVQATNTGVGQGTITQGKQSFTMRSVGGTIYLMANAAFWRANGGKSAAQLFVGKWVSTSATSSTGSQIAPLLNSTSLLKQFFSQTGIQTSKLTTAGHATVAGQSATVIAGHDKTGSGKIYIAASGAPYILKVLFTGKGTSGTMTLTNYNQPVNPAAPPNPVDLDTLSGGSS